SLTPDDSICHAKPAQGMATPLVRLMDGVQMLPFGNVGEKSPVLKAQVSLQSPVTLMQDKRQQSRPSSGSSTRSTPRRQLSQRAMFKSSLRLYVIEISLVEDEPLSAAAPFTDEHAEKSSEVIVDTPPPVLSSPPPASSLGRRPHLLPLLRLLYHSRDAGEASSVAPTRSSPGIVIVSTFSPNFDHRQTILSSSLPAPTHGVRPVVQSSAKIPAKSTLVGDLRFH
ncbi:hypothetical protein GN958_ATG12433, partial [Phytophthora infestans]